MYGKIIKERREKECMTQGELCKAMGMDPSRKSNVSKWESEQIKPLMSTAKKLAEVLGGEPYEYRTTVEDQDGK